METKKKPKRYVYCPGPDKWLSLGQYVIAVQFAKRHPQQSFKCGLTCWWPCSGAEIVQQFRQGLHDRINSALPYSERCSSGVSNEIMDRSTT